MVLWPGYWSPDGDWMCAKFLCTHPITIRTPITRPKVAMVLWPGYWSPDGDWMCAKELCLPESTGMYTRGMTCADCDYLIWGFLDQLVREDIVTGITEALAGDLFCGGQDNPEACSHIIHELIPYAQ